MSDDIVERLRGLIQPNRSGDADSLWPVPRTLPADDIALAASEIERLREALEKIRRRHRPAPMMGGSVPCACAVCTIADTALATQEPKP